jgi:hypothetical protein
MTTIALTIPENIRFKDYAALKGGLTREIARDDLVDEYDDFCDLAEAWLNDLIWHPLREGVATLTKAALDLTLPARNQLPEDFYGLRARKGARSWAEVEQVSPQSFVALNETGLAYSIEADEIVFGSIAPESVTILYWKRIGPLYRDNENWLLTRRPDIYLYAMAVHAESRVENMEKADIYRQYCFDAIDQLNKAGKLYRHGGGPILMVPS